MGAALGGGFFLDNGEWAVDEFDDFADGDGIGWFVKKVSSTRPALALENSSAFEFEKDLLEKFIGDFL